MKHLQNFPNVRIQKYPQGYCVEIERTGILKNSKKWVHIISVSGMSDEPWYYKTFEIALNEAKKYFGFDLIVNSKNTTKEPHIQKNIVFEIHYTDISCSTNGTVQFEAEYGIQREEIENAFYKLYRKGIYRFNTYKYLTEKIVYHA